MTHRTTLTTLLALVVFSFQPATQAGASPASFGPGTGPPSSHPAAIVPNGSWPTYHHDDGHTGYDPTLPVVKSVAPGWISAVLDQSIYAEPLVYGGIVYTATLNNTVYALNQADGTEVWHHTFGAPETGGWPCGNVSPQGILSTPVIDPAAGRIYFAGQFAVDDIYRVLGLNLATGAIELSTKVRPAGFDWTIQQQRGALAVRSGYVYVPFGGRAGDCGSYHGWVVGVPTNGSKTLRVYKTPGIGNGIWTAGGIVVDDSSGNVIAATGNGDVGIGCNHLSNGKPQFENDAVIRLSPTLVHQSFFMPQDWENHWCRNDQDLGSASPLLITPRILFASGKWGSGFLLDPANLGGIDGQRFPTPKPAAYVEANICFGNVSDATFGSFAYAAPYIYAECDGHGVVALKLNTSVPGKPTFRACDPCSAPNWQAGGTHTFGPPIVAAGAVWVADINGSGLYAYRADTGALIYHSAAFPINHFVTPAEAGGQVFVPSINRIRSYNLVTAAVPLAPTSVSATAGDSGATVLWAPSPPDPGAADLSYTITAYGGATPLQQTVFAPATGSYFTGLTNYVTYTFTVLTTNSVGPSPESAPSASVTPPRQAAPSSPIPATPRATAQPAPTISPGGR
jgi:outer membrane protein assembly factor BamB